MLCFCCWIFYLWLISLVICCVVCVVFFRLFVGFGRVCVLFGCMSFCFGLRFIC